MARTYRTMQGREIDMDKLMTRNELMPAIGNAGVNARGDELGPGGSILRKREQVMADYYENNPKAKPEQILEELKTMPYNENIKRTK
ncbi:hypothetical protein EB118_23170 [bacterium]|nr:hypothetical protein [bacterium]NDG79771.1 hypothetical protein [Synechococcaceae bacterium WB8_1B_057]